MLFGYGTPVAVVHGNEIKHRAFITASRDVYVNPTQVSFAFGFIGIISPKFDTILVMSQYTKYD